MASFIAGAVGGLLGLLGPIVEMRWVLLREPGCTVGPGEWAPRGLLRDLDKLPSEEDGESIRSISRM